VRPGCNTNLRVPPSTSPASTPGSPADPSPAPGSHPSQHSAPLDDIQQGGFTNSILTVRAPPATRRLQRVRTRRTRTRRLLPACAGNTCRSPDATTHMSYRVGLGQWRRRCCACWSMASRPARIRRSVEPFGQIPQEAVAPGTARPVAFAPATTCSIILVSSHSSRTDASYKGCSPRRSGREAIPFSAQIVEYRLQ